MPFLPPLPPWEGLHPLLVHLPIGFALAAPLLLLPAVLRHPWAIGFRWAALLLMLGATAGAFLAVETGEAAAEVADRTPEINAALSAHEEFADITRNFLLADTLVWGLALGLTLAPLAGRRPALARQALLVGWVLTLLLQLPTLYYLVHTGHRGGMLVHRYGVLAIVSDTSPPPATAPAQD